ncbi:hypothetical protein [Chryseobacterium vrystaatense]|nr:hypothetical protein [Chryseobacterium vrystaatense]
MLVFTLFNSKWAEKSMGNIPCVPNIGNVHILDFYEETDMNTHALHSVSKIVKHSVRKDDDTASDFSAVLKITSRITLPDIAISTICGVKSFLHLFQLY